MQSRAARLTISIVIGLVAAGFLALQSASSVLTRKQPEIAVQLMALNGLAAEQLAVRKFMTGVKDADDVVPSAAAASEAAKVAFSRDPLSPKSLAVLAIAETDAAKKREILASASIINRRDLLLQGLVLEDLIARQDYAATLQTLDMMLRVHPEQKSSLFPVLMQALSQKEALPALSGLLDTTSEWQSDFFKAAVREPDVLVNLAELRLQRGDVGADVDSRLIGGLFKAGAVGKAYEVYLAASGGKAAQTSQLDWTSQFAPFDWKLADDAGFRAQTGASPDVIEIFVRGGKGGAVAERTIPRPAGSFSVLIDHKLTPPDKVSDVKLQVSCPGADTPFYEEPFRQGPSNYAVGSAPQSCEFINIAIHARAWTGSSAIRGTIQKLKISGQ